jgi:hypothetical protein
MKLRRGLGSLADVFALSDDESGRGALREQRQALKQRDG